MEAKYRLVPEEIPPISKSAVYEKMLDDFMTGQAACCRVEYGRKPATLHQGLLKVRRSQPGYQAVQIVRRGDAIYLKKQ